MGIYDSLRRLRRCSCDDCERTSEIHLDEGMKCRRTLCHVGWPFLLIFLILALHQNPHLPEEVRKSFFGDSDIVVFANQKTPATVRPQPALDIGILMILSENASLSEYELAIDSVRCYAATQRYGFRIERVSDEWRSRCPQKEFMFLRHCIASYLLPNHNWTLFLDADVGVVNPNRLIDDYVWANADEAELVFFDRFFDWEIAAGSYLAHNSTYAQGFLQRFADMELELPDSFTGSDNGAIHWLFVKEFFQNRTSQFSIGDCGAIWAMSQNFDDLFVFEACCRLIFGETRLFLDPQHRGAVRLLPKGTAWMRDGWLTDSQFALESDFMLHGWKSSIRVPPIAQSSAWTRARQRLKFGHWWQQLAVQSFDQAACAAGRMEWRWWQSLLVSPQDLAGIMEEKRRKTQKDLFDSITLIPRYLRRTKSRC